MEREPQPFFRLDPYVRVGVLGMAIYAFFWWISTCGSDQLVIQRYLAAGSLAGARRSLLANQAADVCVGFSTGLGGMALYSYYKAQLPGAPDEVFPHFIAHGLPLRTVWSGGRSAFFDGHGCPRLEHAWCSYGSHRRFRGPIETKKTLTDCPIETCPHLHGGGRESMAVLFCLYLNTIPEGSRGNFFDMTTRIIAYVIGALGWDIRRRLSQATQ